MTTNEFKTMRTTAGVVAMLAAVCAIGLFGRAFAQPEAPAGLPSEVGAEVFVILGTEAEGSIDPALADMPGLRADPFDRFRTLAVLSHTPVRLVTGVPVDVTLPNGRAVTLVLERVTMDGRFRVVFSVSGGLIPRVVVALATCDPFFQAGQRFMGGTLVIAVRILGTACGG